MSKHGETKNGAEITAQLPRHRRRQALRAKKTKAHRLYGAIGGDARYLSGTDIRNRYLTPITLLIHIWAVFKGVIGLDPATEPSNPTRAKRFYTEKGLQLDWGGKKGWTVFLNPPYSEIEVWIYKAIAEARKGARIILLAPVRTDTQYHQALLKAATDIVFLEGRLSFMLPDGSCSGGNAAFGSMLVGLNFSVAGLSRLGQVLVGPKGQHD